MDERTLGMGVDLGLGLGMGLGSRSFELFLGTGVLGLGTAVQGSTEVHTADSWPRRQRLILEDRAILCK